MKKWSQCLPQVILQRIPTDLHMGRNSSEFLQGNNQLRPGSLSLPHSCSDLLGALSHGAALASHRAFTVCLSVLVLLPVVESLRGPACPRHCLLSITQEAEQRLRASQGLQL